MKKKKKPFLAIVEIYIDATDEKSAEKEIEKCIPRALCWTTRVKEVSKVIF